MTSITSSATTGGASKHACTKKMASFASTETAWTNHSSFAKFSDSFDRVYRLGVAFIYREFPEVGLFFKKVQKKRQWSYQIATSNMYLTPPHAQFAFPSIFSAVILNTIKCPQITCDS